MRKGIWGLIGTATLCSLLLPAFPDKALAQSGRAVSMEKSLLGIRLLQTYSAVLKKYGQPTRIFSRDQGVGLDHALDSRGAPTGGIRGIFDEGSGGGATLAGRGGPGGGPGGGPMAAGVSGAGGGRMGASGSPFSGMGMPPGMGAPGSGGPPRMGGGGFSGPGGGGNPYGGGASGSPFSGMRMPPGMGAPGSGGGGFSMGGPRAAGASGGAGGFAGATGGSGRDIPTFADSGGFAWVYFYPGKEIANIFIFNRDKRVIAICHFGNKGGVKTSRGVGLGTPVRSIYNMYGWPNSSENQSLGILSMYYNEKYHVQFDTMKNRVVGVVVALSEDMKYYRSGGGQQGGGGSTFAGGPGGGPMAAGVSGAGGGGKMGAMGGGGGGTATSADF